LAVGFNEESMHEDFNGKQTVNTILVPFAVVKIAFSPRNKNR